MPKAISLFSGCGGSDSGVIQSGFEIVLANDILPYARDVYLANHPETEYRVESIDGIKIFPNAELLVGCYPCQGFSQGGVREPSRKINKLYIEFSRALNAIKPKAFVVENVSGMIRSDCKHLLQDQIRIFSQAGYNVYSSVLNAADYGTPQDRRRIIIVGIRSDFDVRYEFPKPTHGHNLANVHCSIRDAISDMPAWPEGDFYNQSFHWYYLSRNRRRNWDETSKTIVANPRHMPLHPMSPEMVKVGNDVWKFSNDEPARRFSYREAACLQGFGRNMIFPDTIKGSLNMRYTVIGNAVPPQLFKAVVQALPDLWD
jgi:DNA (cytosine-5)-methyltransferase 1